MQLKNGQNTPENGQNRLKIGHILTFLTNNYQERKRNYFIENMEISSREDD